jgi:L-fuculose-phosphate aldolase
VSRALRQAVIDTARRMNALGINQGTSGNVSVRLGDGLLVTPSGVDYDALAPAMIVHMAMDGTWRGDLLPSSEWRIHRDILQSRQEFGAVVHAHSPHATALACLGRGIPAFHYMVAVAGGDSIRCAPYATFGSQALSDHALAALEGRKACLLANHGLLACGADLKQALKIALEVEVLSAQYCCALQIGEPLLLDAAEMQRVLQKFQSYGRQPARPFQPQRAAPSRASRSAGAARRGSSPAASS